MCNCNRLNNHCCYGYVVVVILCQFTIQLQATYSDGTSSEQANIRHDSKMTSKHYETCHRNKTVPLNHFGTSSTRIAHMMNTKIHLIHLARGIKCRSVFLSNCRQISIDFRLLKNSVDTKHLLQQTQYRNPCSCINDHFLCLYM